MANKHNIDGAGGIQVTLSQQEAKQFLLLPRELIILQEIFPQTTCRHHGEVLWRYMFGF